MALMEEREKWLKRALSRHQVSTMRYISMHAVKVQHLGQAQQNTLGSLLQRGYLLKAADDSIDLSEAGYEALNLYESSQWSERQTTGELTERVSNLLRYARAVRGRSSAA